MTDMVEMVVGDEDGGESVHVVAVRRQTLLEAAQADAGVDDDAGAPDTILF